ncbi:GA module-containing protein, partial [Corynebacterium propinquum]|uniref:GA module-containing protein n=1 Tax=Corynebacterium propinquum TaxID=43769 RepID=UPI0025401C23
SFADDKAKAGWKDEFSKLVHAKEKELFPEYYSVPSAKDYFDSREQAIASALRLADGSVGQPVNEIVDKHVAELEQAGFSFADDKAKAGWKDEFSKLVHAKEKELFVKDNVGKHRGVIQSVLEANANSVEDPNKAALTAEDLAFPFAQHRDEVAEDLIEAKRAGVAAVDGAQHLSDGQKTAYKAAIEAAASDSQIDELVYAALDANDLEAGYAKIFAQLGLTENPGFSPNEKKWTSEDFANSFKQHAANEEAKDLQEVRDAGSAAVDGIYDLTENQKSAYKKQIAAAGSEDAVSEIVFAALDLADKQGAQEAGQDTVAAEKTRVLKVFEGFSNLTDQQKADFKKKVDEANTVAYLQVLVEMAAQLNAKQSEQAGSPEPKPSDDTISEETESPAKPSSEFGFSNIAKGLFGATAILGVIGIVFGGVAHAIKHFPGFEHVHNQVRETLAKFGIRF